MAKQSGVGSALWFGAYDLSGDIGSVNTINTSRGVFDTTAIDKGAMERILGRRDGSLSFTSFWNHAAGHSNLILSALARTDSQVTVAVGPSLAVGSHAASLVAKQTDYAPAFGADGSLVASIEASANGYPLEWGQLLTTGKQTFASGDIDGSSIDAGGATAFGLAAYLHVFSLTSGDPILTITDSANDSDFATLGPTAVVFSPTAAGVERQQIGLTAAVRQYLRLEVSGTYAGLVCALSIVRYTKSAA